MLQIKKILVANRGEIALRIIRTAREMGIKTVAVYSDVDRTALHVRHADEAVYIGKSESTQSYLDIQKVVQAAKTSAADAVHPGYGFLSENPAFAEACEKAGIKLIGPSASAMRIMGSKLAAKEAVKKHNIPLVPGTDYAIANLEEGMDMAAKIGFPVLIKASAGGGGKGMRIVDSPDDFAAAMQTAINEASSAFGDGSVFIEKFIASPKHIEFQILADEHGNIVHLFERECSIQRRHQKVVEEAPSTALDDQLREIMGNCAVEVAKACDYTGAGTVEFLVDEKKNFYFLEMNTRLQVEHPVTEMITGIDLVGEQIRIARGEKLSFTQKDLSISGHSIEVRVYAEDPGNNFLPDIGTLRHYELPRGNGVRVDDAYEAGMEIPIYYDPMIAKLIVFAPDRNSAIQKMIRAINEYRIVGVETTLDFCRSVMENKSFQNGNFDTNYIHKHFDPLKIYHEVDSEMEIVVHLAAFLQSNQKQATNASQTVQKNFNWRYNRLK